MENPIIDLIHQHRSVRYYKPDTLPASMVESIIAAAQNASTSSNLQAYSVIAVADAGKRTQLSKLCGNQPHVREAPVFLAWCADLARLDRVCELRGCSQVTEFTENFLVAAIDASLAAQNAALAAESLELGICYIGSIRNNATEIIELLDLPKLTFPITGMTLGWPEKQSGIKPRLPIRAVLHWESYSQATVDEDLRDYDKTMIATGIYNNRQVPIPGKPDEMEDYGWTEHTARRVSLAARTELHSELVKQGFLLK
jgi:FMN reductase (NADPH)